MNQFLQKAPVICSYSPDMPTAGGRRGEQWALQCGWTGIMLMQLFSLSGFGVNSPRDDTLAFPELLHQHEGTSGQKHQCCEYWTRENPASPDAGGT